MKNKLNIIILAFVILLMTVCTASCGTQYKNANANVSREKAIQKIQDISQGSGNVDIKSYPEMDQVAEGIRYYYIEVAFGNKMSAAYFVDEKKGQIFVAYGGELDTENPLPMTDPDALNASAEDSEASTDVAEIKATQSSAVKDIFDIIGKTSEQVVQKFGDNFKKVSMNYDSYMDGYFYSDLGLTAAFGSDGMVACVYCTDKIEINGARSGMDFSQIQDKLGETHLSQKWADTPINAAYEIIYNYDGRTVVFFSHQKDGDSCIMSIR